MKLFIFNFTSILRQKRLHLVSVSVILKMECSYCKEPKCRSIKCIIELSKEVLKLPLRKKVQIKVQSSHLNINSIFSKVDSLHEILDSDNYDILFLNESKLNMAIPDSHISHTKYKCYRRDRDYLSSSGLDKHGGGIVIYIRKECTHSVQKSDSFEIMQLCLMLKA
jgi:hypothetical protein